MIKIVIVDGQEIYRADLKLVLSTHNDFEVIGTGKDGYEAIKLTAALRPDIILIDMFLPLIDGVKVASILKYRSPATSVIIMMNSNADNKEYMRQALSCGAAGYVVKESDRDYLAVVIRTVHRGDCFLSPKLVAGIFRFISASGDKMPVTVSEKVQLSGITDVELLIISYIGQGFSNKEIADKLKIKQGTVRNYISSVLRKTKLRDRTQIAIRAVTQGFASPTGPAKPAVLGRQS